MNRSIRLVSLFAIILTAILLVNLTVIQAFSEDKYAHNPRNMRGFMEMQTTPRGQIFAGNTVLATSHTHTSSLLKSSSLHPSPQTKACLGDLVTPAIVRQFLPNGVTFGPT